MAEMGKKETAKPEDPVEEGVAAGAPKMTRGERKRKQAAEKKKTIRRDIVVIAVFLVLSAAAVLFVNRWMQQKASAENKLQESSVESTAEAPTTEGPTTETPTTEAPTTEEPTTEAPTTEAPTTEAPPPATQPAAVYYPNRELVPGLSIPVQSGITMPSWITQDLLLPGADARPGTQIGEIKHIVIHYVGNKGSSPKDNRDYFQANNDGRKVSSHFIVGIYGEIIQCIPLNEVAYAQGIAKEYVDRGAINHNYDSISIENCHPDDTGEFTSDTYCALVKLTAWLLQKYHLDVSALMRHYDATNQPSAGIHGKACPYFYVANPFKWEEFKYSVQLEMELHPNIE